MDKEDIVQIQDVAAARAYVLRTRRKVLTTAAITPLLVALLAFLTVHYLGSVGTATSLVIAAVLLLLGIPVFIHWQRHFQRILWQLDVLDRRVSSGEVIHGSQVAFRSYR